MDLQGPVNLKGDTGTDSDESSLNAGPWVPAPSVVSFDQVNSTGSIHEEVLSTTEVRVCCDPDQDCCTTQE